MEIFQGQLEMDDLGYILTKGKSTKQINLEYLPQGMFRITNTGKQLLLRERAVWQILMQKDTLDLFNYFSIWTEPQIQVEKFYNKLGFLHSYFLEKLLIFKFLITQQENVFNLFTVCI